MDVSSLTVLDSTKQENFVVVVQLVERSLPTPEVRGSTPVIANIYILNICSLYLKDEAHFY